MNEARKVEIMQTERRTFLRQSLLMSYGTIIGSARMESFYPAATDTTADLFAA